MPLTWRGFKDAAEFISYLSVIVAIPIAFMEYYSGSAQARVDRSIQYLASFRSADFRLDRDRIERPWRNYDVQRLNNLQGNTAVVDSLASGFVQADPELRPSLMNVVEALDEMGICIRNDICDAGIIREQMGAYVRSLKCLYGREIAAAGEQLLLPELGTQLEQIAPDGGC